MRGLVAMVLLSAAQPPIITIPKNDGKPEGHRSPGPEKIITIPKDGGKPEGESPSAPEKIITIPDDTKRTVVAPQAVPDRGKEIADLKAEVTRLNVELANERNRQKEALERHRKELSEVREQLNKTREELNALEAARRPVTTTSRKPLEPAQAPRESEAPSAVSKGADNNPEKPPAAQTPPADRALVRIRTADGVRIIVDGVWTKSTGTHRVFISPPLTPGQRYQYTVVAERTDGEGTARVTRTLSVRAGTQTEVEIYP